MRFDNVKWDRSMTSAFGGLNRHERIGDGEWAEMENLTTEEYPVAMVRAQRRKAKWWTANNHVDGVYHGEGPRIWATYLGSGVYEPHHLCNAATVNGELFLLDDHGCLYREGDEWSEDLGLAFTGKLDIETAPAREQMVAMGRDLVFKGGAVFRRATDGLEGSSVGEKIADLLGRVQYAHAKIKAPCTVTPVDSEGKTVTINTTKPDPAANGDYYYDASTAGLYRYSEAQGEWVPVADCFIKLTFDCSSTVSASDLDLQDGWASLFDGTDRNDLVAVNVHYDIPELAQDATPLEVAAWFLRIASFLIWGLRVTESGVGFVADFEQNYIVERAYADPLEDGKYVMILRGMYNKRIFNDSLSPSISVERRMPNLDYICEHQNRVWGCRYGTNDRGEFVNEIYGTALGDPLNWFRYEGTAADSYTASVGTGEAFTGCCSLDDYVVFFKKDRVYLLSGSEPSNFRLREIICPGIQEGSYRSIVTLNSAVYYKGERGFYRMTAYNLPSLISDALGEDHWHGAICGTDGRRIYFSVLRDSDEVQELYNYYTFTGMWTRESGFRGVIPLHGTGEEEDLPVAAMLPYAGNMLVICTARREYYDHLEFFFPRPSRLPSEFYMTNTFPYDLTTPPQLWGADLLPEDPVKWYGVTGLLGLKIGKSAYPFEKRVRQITVRLKAEAGTLVRVSIMLDESGQWIKVCDERRQKTGSFTIRYAPAARCDMYRLLFEGEGDCVIYSIEEETEYGGEN